jgi:hypothetical protein
MLEHGTGTTARCDISISEKLKGLIRFTEVGERMYCDFVVYFI